MPEQIPLEAACRTLAAGQEVSIALADGGHWFGHGFAHDQPWPLDAGTVVNDAFAVNNIQCPIWMCSAGYVVLAETLAPLAVSLNRDGDGCLRITPSEPTTLRVFAGGTLAEARAALLAHLGAGRPTPPRVLLGDSIFCTWTQYPRCITQERILQMARTIRAEGYPCSTITIDDRWERCFGELAFGDDFPDPPAMVRELHELGFRVLLWVTPFVNREAATFADLEGSGALVRHRTEPGAALLRWWGGTAGLVDLTGEAGRDWYRGRLLHLQREIGIDGFKIDGGDAKYQPAAEIAAFCDPPGASGYIDRLLALFEEIAPGVCESRTAWLSQGRNILWRLGGKDSHWGEDNGLRALLHLSLHLALCGYDMLMPDMVPGRVQTLQSDLPLPTDELVIRWTEVSAFLPLLQFSYYPWNYARPAADAVLGYARLHKALEPYLADCAADADAPLFRPFWFDHPERTDLVPVADQFLLGPDLMACPVLAPGVDARDVVVPEDGWVDAWTGEAVAAGMHAAWPAPCPGSPVFVRQANGPLVDAVCGALSGIQRGSVPAGVTTATYEAGLDRDLSVTG